MYKEERDGLTACSLIKMSRNGQSRFRVRKRRKIADLTFSSLFRQVSPPRTGLACSSVGCS